MIDEKHLAATIKNRFPRWQTDAVDFMKELLADRAELLAKTTKVEIVEKVVVEKPAVVEPKADEQVKVETTATVEKKPAKKPKKGLFGRK